MERERSLIGCTPCHAHGPGLSPSTTREYTTPDNFPVVWLISSLSERKSQLRGGWKLAHRGRSILYTICKDSDSSPQPPHRSTIHRRELHEWWRGAVVSPFCFSSYIWNKEKEKSWPRSCVIAYVRGPDSV